MTDQQRPAIAYRRVSTGEQALSIDAQLPRIAEYVAIHGYELVAVYTDNGVSGGQYPSDREQCGKALADLHAGKADTLICTTHDRLSRSLDVLTLYRELAAAGVTVRFTDEPDPTLETPEDFLTLAVKHAVAEYTLLKISDQTRKALAERKRQGMRLGRPTSAATQAAIPVAVPLREQGATLQDIADLLNDDGYRTARGKPFTTSTVRNVLRTHELDESARRRRHEHRPTGEDVDTGAIR